MTKDAPTAFFGRTFDEALALTREARDYLRDYGEEESRELAVDVAAHFSVEIMRLTSRLTNMMAWLLVQRAVHQGELSREEVREDNWRLGGGEICLKKGAVDPEMLPPYLCDLLRRSERLYRRIARLDDMVASESG
jgi:regulator of CtrA degradation